MSERRYSEAEVAEIFRLAAEAQTANPAPIHPAEGRTLAELQAIARQVGLPPELVSRAAASLDAGPPDRRSFLGFPLAVGRTVELGRVLSDQEWERVVVDLRETFDARGQVRVQGSLREWTNGNLQALLEPGETGHRLRLRTLKGDARAIMTAGLALLGMALAILVGFGLTGSLAEHWGSAVFLAVLGGLLFGVGALRLPGWAATRLAQMDEIAARLAAPPAPGRDDDP